MIENNNEKDTLANILKEEIQKTKDMQAQLILSLEKLSGLSEEKARELLIKNIEKKYNELLARELKNLQNQTEEKIKEQANKILATAIERYSGTFLASKTITKIDLGDSKLKGKIIGKDGRNIKTFEEKSGVDLIMENGSNTIRFSSFNPVRREIAQRAMKKLIEDGRIQPQKIEDFLKSEERNINIIILETGKKIANELNIFDFKEEILKSLGTLKYRTSYAQNVLVHSIEVAKIAGALAEELELDTKIAIRGGLLHDIGKSISFEINKTHVQLGVEIAERNQENNTIINIIASHHGDEKPNNIYSYLVQAADTISAAREGARDNVQEDYLKRMKTIELTCKSISGVKESYAVKSGRVIRVFVDSTKVNDYQTEKIADEITRKLKKELKVPGEIIIKIIREFEIERKI